MDEKIQSIGGIGNYYGGLSITEDGGKFFWSIENYDGHGWEEIPESLYRALIAFSNGSLATTASTGVAEKQQGDSHVMPPVAAPVSQHASSVEVLRAALERIARWHGEFPSQGKWEDGTPKSYGGAFGSNGERDYMRQVALDALAAAPASPAPSAKQEPSDHVESEKEALRRLAVQSMADCMDMVRQDLIDMGIIDKSVAPMFIPEAIASHIKRLAAPSASASPAAPVAGSQHVPVEPTSEMLQAAHAAENCGHGNAHFRNAYAAMLAAAPAVPVPVEPQQIGEQHPVIALGYGKIEVAEGFQNGVPALIFGPNGSGVMGEKLAGNRTMESGEALASVTFANAESVDVVSDKLALIRARLAPSLQQGKEGASDD